MVMNGASALTVGRRGLAINGCCKFNSGWKELFHVICLCGAKEEKRKKIVVSRTKQTLSDAVEIRDWSNAKRRIRGLE